MKQRDKTYKASGFSLIEMLIAMATFSIIMTVIYSTFSSVSNQVSELSDKQALTQKGQRVMDYMGEQLRLAGLFVGARPSITFCGTANVDSLQHTDGASNDTVIFLTSERTTTAADGTPFLFTNANALIGANMLTVNAAQGNVSAITSTAGTNNARAFITLDTLQPNLGALVYEVTAYNNNTGVNAITVNPAIDQQVNQSSNIYSVVRKMLQVDASRNLELVEWNTACTNTGTTYEIVESHGAGSAEGGVDGFQVEYTLSDGTSLSALTAANIANVRSITIWMLLRSDFPSQSYTNTTIYTLGSANPVSLVAFNDNYRRVLLTKTVEVKNLGL